MIHGVGRELDEPQFFSQIFHQPVIIMSHIVILTVCVGFRVADDFVYNTVVPFLCILFA